MTPPDDPKDGYITAEALAALWAQFQAKRRLRAADVEHLLREHARLSILTHELIWNSLGCPQHKSYRGTNSRPPARECRYCRGLWEWHQEHDKSQRFQDVLAEQRRRVDALLTGVPSAK